jgi:two-component system sensor kinase FixL
MGTNRSADRQIAMAERRWADEDLLAVFDALSAHIAVLDRDGTILAVNSAWKRFAKRNDFAAREYGVGQNYLNAYNADVLAASSGVQALEGVREVIQGCRESFQMEYACHSPHEEHWFVMRVTRLPSPEPFRVLVAHEDITSHKRIESALRQSQERLSAILESAAEGVVVITAEGVIETFNKAAEKMFAYTAEEALGQDVSLLLPEPYSRLHNEFVGDYMRTGEGRVIGIGREVVGRRKDGSLFPMYLAVSEVHNERHRLFTAMIHDVTDHKLLEKQVLEIACEEQRRIGQDLHDSIGQELTGLSLSVRALVDELRRQLRPEAVAAARIAAWLSEAQQHVRELSRSLIPREIDAHGLSDALEQLAERTAALNDFKCTYHCHGPIDVPDQFVATQLYRIAQEAVNNAIKHSGGKHVMIEIDMEGKPLSLIVRDDGIGIDATPAQSDGMGLRIMQHRAKLIGADLSIGRGANGGTVVKCTLNEG